MTPTYLAIQSHPDIQPGFSPASPSCENPLALSSNEADGFIRAASGRRFRAAVEPTWALPLPSLSAAAIPWRSRSGEVFRAADSAAVGSDVGNLAEPGMA